jgi:uncharacterized ion transporter superfamily protein YfcC
MFIILAPDMTPLVHQNHTEKQSGKIKKHNSKIKLNDPLLKAAIYHRTRKNKKGIFDFYFNSITKTAGYLN